MRQLKTNILTIIRFHPHYPVLLGISVFNVQNHVFTPGNQVSCTLCFILFCGSFDFVNSIKTRFFGYPDFISFVRQLNALKLQSAQGKTGYQGWIGVRKVMERGTRRTVIIVVFFFFLVLQLFLDQLGIYTPRNFFHFLDKGHFGSKDA